MIICIIAYIKIILPWVNLTGVPHIRALGSIYGCFGKEERFFVFQTENVLGGAKQEPVIQI